MKFPSAAALINRSVVAFGGTANMPAKPLKTRGSEYPLHDNQSLTVRLRNRNVCACLSSICGGICFILCSPSASAGAWRRHVAQMLFLSKHKAGISERRAYLCRRALPGCICHVGDGKWDCVWCSLTRGDGSQVWCSSHYVRPFITIEKLSRRQGKTNQRAF